jgi:high-affinity Fe2+/Pb2+ permease
MASDEQRQPSTPPWLWGSIGGAVVSVLIGVLWTGGGAGIALLIPFFALVLCPIGAVLGWFIGCLWAWQHNGQSSSQGR